MVGNVLPWLSFCHTTVAVYHLFVWSLLCHTYYILAGSIQLCSTKFADAIDVDATAEVQYSTAPLQYSFIAG